MYDGTKNLAIANRSHVSCAHKVTTRSWSRKWLPFKGHSRSSKCPSHHCAV